MPDPGAAAMPVATMTDLVGRVFNGEYRVMRRVGAGSMGDVYEGLRLSDQQAIAIKVLKPEHAVREVFRHRFLREAKSAVMIDHPNVVDVLDFGEAEGGWLFIAMEFLEGESLQDYLKRLKRLTWRQSCALLQQAASGLAAAHDQGVVHRDVKPSNILLVDDSAGGGRVKIVDFGVAKMPGHVVSRVLTAVDDVIGTVFYMSPEQAEGREADLRSDIYALGVTAYELATGRVPFEGKDMFQVMMGHLEGTPTPPSQLVPNFPPAANDFILRCLAKRPEDRFASMHEVVAMLQATEPASVALPPPVKTTTGTVVVAASSVSQGQIPPAMEDEDGDFEEAPTGYFFRPVSPTQGAVPVHARPSTVPAPPMPNPTPRVVSTPPVAPTPAATPRVVPPPMAVPAAPGGFAPLPSGSVPGGTVRMPSVPTPIVDDDEFIRPAGTMSAATVFLVVMVIIAAVAAVVYLFAFT